MTDFTKYLPDLMTGDELLVSMTVLPRYDESIRDRSASQRMIALSDLYNIYLPSPMSVEIYSKLYLAMLRSMQKKGSRYARVQLNENHRMISLGEGNGILGGADSFTIIGSSGIGKSSAINRAIQLITSGGIITLDRPYTQIIPCLVVQCPFDCSVKGLLLEILRKVDEALNTDYYPKAVRNRVTTDMLIGCVSQVSLNHIGLLVVDEIQNVVNNKHGKTLVGMLTQLINNSGISIGMVGTPESTVFFERELQLARRSLGLQYGPMAYDDYFYRFCQTLYGYQYTRKETELTDLMVQWLYEHSGGILSVVVSLIHDAQEIAILSGTEELNIGTLNEAFQKRLTMLHGYVEPKQTGQWQTNLRQKEKESLPIVEKTDPNQTIEEVVSLAKAEGVDVFERICENFTVEVIAV